MSRKVCSSVLSTSTDSMLLLLTSQPPSQLCISSKWCSSKTNTKMERSTKRRKTTKATRWTSNQAKSQSRSRWRKMKTRWTKTKSQTSRMITISRRWTKRRRETRKKDRNWLTNKFSNWFRLSTSRFWWLNRWICSRRKTKMVRRGKREMRMEIWRLMKKRLKKRKERESMKMRRKRIEND